MGSSSAEEDTRARESDEEDKREIKQGRTVLAKVNRMRDKNEKFKVQWNTKGRPIGKTRANFMSYLGMSTRSRVNINIPRWDQVPTHIKEAIWIDVSGVFDIPQHKMRWLLSQAGERWRNFKSDLTNKYMFDKDKNIRPHPPSKYSYIDQDTWDEFIATRQTDKFKEESEKHRAIVTKNEYPFRAARKGYAGLEEEMILESQKEQTSSQGPPLTASSMSIPRHELWLAARTRRDGNMDESVRKIADQMELVSQQASQGEANFSGRQDILASVLGKKEHPGRVRAAGSGVSITQYFGKDDKQEAKLIQMEAQILHLQRELAKVQRKDNHPHHGEGKIPSESVQDIDFPEGWTECLLASEEPGHPIVATGKVFYTYDTKTVMIHNKPLQHGNLKVEVIEAKMPEAPLPFPIDEACVVFDVVNSFVEWPKNLIFLEKITSGNNKKRKRDGLDIDTHSESSNTINKSQPRKVPNELLMTAEQDSKLKTSSPTIQMMYKIARNMEVTLSISIPKELSYEGQLWITKEEIFQWIFQEEIQATHISVYFGYLIDTFLQDNKILARFGHLCPHKIAEVPIGFKEDQQKERHILAEERATERARYIADAMKNAKKNQMLFAPYNAKRHWMLCVVHPFKEIVYWFDPLGLKVRNDIKSVIEMAMKMWIAQRNLNRPKKPIKWIEVKSPCQTNNTDCGYYVLRYILDIMRGGQDSTPGECYPELIGSKPLSNDKIDEVRDQ